MPTTMAPSRVGLKNVLFATDFSPSSQVAASYAVAFARHYGATLYSVNVIAELAQSANCPSAQEQTKIAVQERFRGLLASRAFAGIQHTELIGEGKIARVLVNLVHQYGIDIIVIGTKGRTGLRKLWLGSVAEEVFRAAECPVLTVGPHVEPRANLTHVLVATDFGIESKRALSYASFLAEEYKTRLTLLHVTPEPAPELNPWMPPSVTRQELIALSEKKLRTLFAEQTPAWQEPTYLTQFGFPAETILKTAARDIDLIVLGVHRPKNSSIRLGDGVAYRVVCKALCPVLCVGVSDGRGWREEDKPTASLP